MASVLQDAELTEFLRDKWAKSTTWQRREMVLSVVEFFAEQRGEKFVAEAFDEMTPEPIDDLADEVQELIQDVSSLSSDIDGLKISARDILRQLKERKK